MADMFYKDSGMVPKLTDAEKKLCTPDIYSHRDVLILYLRIKVASADWHAVSDAANDLRVLDGK